MNSITTDGLRTWAEALRKGQEKQIVPDFKRGVEFAADVLTNWAAELDEFPEPEPPKKARRITLTNKEGYWYWEIWQEEEPGSWAKVVSMTIGYASIAEAADVAGRWLRNNP